MLTRPSLGLANRDEGWGPCPGTASTQSREIVEGAVAMGAVNPGNYGCVANRDLQVGSVMDLEAELKLPRIEGRTE